MSQNVDATLLDSLSSVMTLGELAKLNGISTRTASRYRRDGVDLTNRKPVENQFEQRSRFGVSKFFRRQNLTTQRQVVERLQARIGELEGIVPDSFLLAGCIKNEHPGAAQLADEIIEKTEPAISHLLEDF